VSLKSWYFDFTFKLLLKLLLSECQHKVFTIRRFGNQLLLIRNVNVLLNTTRFILYLPLKTEIPTVMNAHVFHRMFSSIFKNWYSETETLDVSEFGIRKNVFLPSLLPLITICSMAFKIIDHFLPRLLFTKFQLDDVRSR
jgi:hypothetical protein